MKNPVSNIRENTPAPVSPAIDDPMEDRQRAAIEYLYGWIDYEKLADRRDQYVFRLTRMRELMRRLGLGDSLHDPDTPAQTPPLTTVHIAGTKGKGSTATMIAAILSARGVRTGLYTSPHLHSLRERFRIDGRPCGGDRLVQMVDRIRPIVAELADSSLGPPSFFELTTAMALWHFRDAGCQAQVIEVGLGGRLDSTNVIQPSLSLITSIGLDHQHVLGNTLAAIAREKAGIIKPGVPVISGVRGATANGPSEAARVIEEVSGASGSHLAVLGDDFDFDCVPREPWGSRVTIRTPHGPTRVIDLSAEGDHQAANATLAVITMRKLAAMGLIDDVDDGVEALDRLDLIGRVERFDLGDGQTVIVDTAHNEDSIAALIECVRRRFLNGASGPRPLTVVFGTSRDKNAAVMLRQLREVSSSIVLTRFHGNPRFCPTDRLAQQAGGAGFTDVERRELPDQALAEAKRQVGENGVVIVCGSFFLADEVRRLLCPK